VFVLSALGAAAFAATGLMLHLLARGSRDRQRRAALLWTANPLLLQLLVAGAHVDTLAIAFAVAAVAMFRLSMSMQNAPLAGRRAQTAALGAGAGAAAGLAFAVKVSMLLVPAGLLVAAAVAGRARSHARRGPDGGLRPDVLRRAWQPVRRARTGPVGPAGRNCRGFALAAGGLAAGFAATAAASLLPWGLGSLGPALRAGSYASLASPWRGVRAALSLAAGEPAADTAIKVGAATLTLAVAALFARPLAALARGPARPLSPAHGRPGWLRRGGAGAEPPSVLAAEALPAAAVSVVVVAWLAAWPYVLPWYDGLGWGALAALPWLPAPWAALDWLLLARTTALALGYLPARGVAMPADLGWLRSVVRTGVTPVVLLALLAVLMGVLRPPRGTRAGPAGGRGHPAPFSP
jgi:hypothetical protein